MATQPGGSVTSRAASESRSGPGASSAAGSSSGHATGAKFRHGLLQLMIHTIDPLHDGISSYTSLLLCVSCESSIHPSIPLSIYLPISLSHSLFGPLSVSIYVCARYLREFYASHAFRGLNFSVLVDAAADWGPYPQSYFISLRVHSGLQVIVFDVVHTYMVVAPYFFFSSLSEPTTTPHN